MYLLRRIRISFSQGSRQFTKTPKIRILDYGISKKLIWIQISEFKFLEYYMLIHSPTSFEWVSDTLALILSESRVLLSHFSWESIYARPSRCTFLSLPEALISLFFSFTLDY